MDFIIRKLLILPGIIIALTFHEFAHAKVASLCGDDTAKNAGRVSLNPLRHFDPIGFLCLFLVGFGWGKPVPVNPYNLSGKNRKLKQVAISAAGVTMNFVLALVLAIVLTALAKFLPGIFTGDSGYYFYTSFYYAVYINVVLMIFNLIPVPPLDGFNIVAELTSFDETEMYYKFLRYGSLILILLLITNVIDYILTPGIDGVMKIITLVLNMIFK